MKPDATQHNPAPEYIRALVEASGLTQRAAAEAIGISPRLLRYYCSGGRECTYPVQYALEQLSRDP